MAIGSGELACVDVVFLIGVASVFTPHDDCFVVIGVVVFVPVVAVETAIGWVTVGWVVGRGFLMGDALQHDVIPKVKKILNGIKSENKAHVKEVK